MLNTKYKATHDSTSHTPTMSTRNQQCKHVKPKARLFEKTMRSNPDSVATELSTELQLFKSSGRTFHWIVAFTEKADCPNAVQQNGIVQSCIEDILEDLIELTEYKHTYKQHTSFYFILLVFSLRQEWPNLYSCLLPRVCCRHLFWGLSCSLFM